MPLYQIYLRFPSLIQPGPVSGHENQPRGFTFFLGLALLPLCSYVKRNEAQQVEAAEQQHKESKVVGDVPGLVGVLLNDLFPCGDAGDSRWHLTGWLKEAVFLLINVK